MARSMSSQYITDLSWSPGVQLVNPDAVMGIRRDGCSGSGKGSPAAGCTSIAPGRPRTLNAGVREGHTEAPLLTHVPTQKEAFSVWQQCVSRGPWVRLSPHRMYSSKH